MITRAYPADIDCVWIASDGNAHLGAFVTAGVGPIPIQALSSDLLDISDVGETVCQLPQVSNVRLLFSLERPDDFIALAERGFFVYDWQDVHRTDRESKNAYEPIAVPLNPLSSGALPEPLAHLAANVVLRDCDFAAGEVVDVCAQMECCSS